MESTAFVWRLQDAEIRGERTEAHGKNAVTALLQSNFAQRRTRLHSILQKRQSTYHPGCFAQRCTRLQDLRVDGVAGVREAPHARIQVADHQAGGLAG